MGICGHFTGVICGLRECLLYQRMGMGVLVNENVLDSVGPEPDVNGME